jgi:peptidoglycan/xylan/chitin deacetylase (PgdA/CDA1 family)
MDASTDKLFSFRWDIDHRACMTDGIPRVREICRRFGVKNTFFVNMGRSTNLREWLGKGFKGSMGKLNNMEAVHLIKKIGWPRFVLETLLSRPVGRSFVAELQALQADGHELGQHGGADHVIWSRRFAELPAEVIERDVAETHEEFTRHFGRPAGFTSPGFKSDDRIARIVDKLGYDYDGDAIGGDPTRVAPSGLVLDHWRIPVTICGPSTVPFLEWHGARGTPEKDILGEIGRVTRDDSWVVLYGHPCYEGVNDGLLAKVFEHFLERGFRFVTHAAMSERLAAGRAPA